MSAEVNHKQRELFDKAYPIMFSLSTPNDFILNILESGISLVENIRLFAHYENDLLSDKYFEDLYFSNIPFLFPNKFYSLRFDLESSL